MSEARRLAAILTADVVGYSRMMGEDEAGTARLVRERREAATPIVRGFGGRLVKTTGDGVLLAMPCASPNASASSKACAWQARPRATAAGSVAQPVSKSPNSSQLASLNVASADLQGAINRFLDDYNAHPKPFQWVAAPDKIIAAVRRGHQVLDSIH
jgi:hypothetical protein